MSTATQPIPPQTIGIKAYRGLGVLAAVLTLVVLATLLRRLGLLPNPFPAEWDLHLREPIDQFKSWVIAHRTSHPLFLFFFDPLSDLIETGLRGLEQLLLGIAWPALLIFLYAVANKAGGRRLAIFSVAGVVVMGLFGLWQESMETLALMSVAVFLSLLIGIPLGILAARHPRFDALLRPLLDVMQTMPAFVYLIPVLLFFGIARVPSIIATVIYALPPAIRLTSLGLRQVEASALEAAAAFGSTPGQTLRKVALPLALPSILVGVNQTIMMALGIVVIAALIGAGGLGWEVLDALRSLKVGQALEAGLAIVMMAMIFDRISDGFAQGSQPRSQHRVSTGQHKAVNMVSPWLLNYVYWSTTLLFMLILMYVDSGAGILHEFPQAWRISIRGPVDALVDWMKLNLYEIGGLPIGAGPLSDFLVIYWLNPLRNFFQQVIPWPVLILAVGLLAYTARGWWLAIWCMVGMLALGLLGMWSPSMDTLSQVLVAVLLTVVIGLPVGVWTARSNRVEVIVRPLLDFLQTIPPFVYLVPVIMLFNIGRVPGVIAAVLYALPPMVRLTHLGIRQAPAAAIEAAEAFGSTAWQKLVKVQLPLALPSILAGVNQAVMMVLAMVVIAGLVGGGALGLEAVNGLARGQLGRGIEAGLSIVILAIVLDRITQGWGEVKG
jgi:glycine betaine/proline transport system permease protein